MPGAMPGDFVYRFSFFRTDVVDRNATMLVGVEIVIAHNPLHDPDERLSRIRLLP